MTIDVNKPKRKVTYQHKIVGALLASMIVLLACSVSPTIISELSEQLVEVATPTIAITDTPVNPAYVEIDKNIMAFLRAEGDYSDEALAEKPHMGYEYVGMGGASEMLQGNYLGIMGVWSFGNGTNDIESDNWVEFDTAIARYQAIFLGGIYENSQVTFFMGMVDRDGKRIVAPIGRSVNPEDDSEYYLNIGRFDGGSRNINHTGTGNLYIPLDKFDKVNNLIGDALVFTCVPKPIEGQLRDAMLSTPPRGIEILENSDASIPLCRALYNSVADVRNRDLPALDGADPTFSVYDILSFDGIQSILKENLPLLFYGDLFFVSL
jgi:hypothetical protein